MVKRYVPVDQWGQDMPKCMVEDDGGPYVRASDHDALAARLAEAEAMLREAGVYWQPERVAAFLRATSSATPASSGDATRAMLAASAEAAPDLMQHCCPSCGQPSGKGIDLFTYMAELVTKHPTAKGMLDFAMARATTSASGAQE